MLLYLKAKLDELKLDDHLFFRMAHVWRFGRDIDPWNDTAQFRLHGIIPVYVKEYLCSLQGDTNQLQLF